MRKLTCIFALLLVSLSTAADEEKIDLHVEIKLLSSLDVEKKHSHVICEVDGTYFQVPRSMLDKEVILTAPNGISIGFPWQKGQCYESDVF